MKLTHTFVFCIYVRLPVESDGDAVLSITYKKTRPKLGQVDTNAKGSFSTFGSGSKNIERGGSRVCSNFERSRILK